MGWFYSFLISKTPLILFDILCILRLHSRFRTLEILRLRNWQHVQNPTTVISKKYRIIFLVNDLFLSTYTTLHIIYDTVIEWSLCQNSIQTLRVQCLYFESFFGYFDCCAKYWAHKEIQVFHDHKILSIILRSRKQIQC
jgi:hypothetical protein